MLSQFLVSHLRALLLPFPSDWDQAALMAKEGKMDVYSLPCLISHRLLTTTSSSFRVRNKGELQVELENKEKKKSQVSGAAIFWIRVLGC